MISIFDYGAGNLQSIASALDAIGEGHEIVRDAAAVWYAKHLILPGVGNFGQMIQAIDRMGVRTALVDRIEHEAPFLGICLGMQALFDSSAEAPNARGLGILKGNVARFGGSLRVPQMGWNSVRPRCYSRLLRGVADGAHVYFANSYYAPVCADTAASCEYGGEFTAAIEHRNLFGVQFHPEKSGAVGLQILKNFAQCL